MNRISLFVLLILVFLGVSKSFSPSEQRTQYIRNEKMLAPSFYGTPVSVILTDSFTTGFLIKTYFQRYRVIHAFKLPETVTVRTSKDFWEKNIKNRGMSIFRRMEEKAIESILPLPPGSLYLGNPSYGRWRLKNSGMRVWRFYRAYRHFPSLFFWGKFRPNKEFYKKLTIHLNNSKPFYGLNHSFGNEGTITKQNLKNSIQNGNSEDINFKQLLARMIKVTPWSIKED